MARRSPSCSKQRRQRPDSGAITNLPRSAHGTATERSAESRLHAGPDLERRDTGIADVKGGRRQFKPLSSERNAFPGGEGLQQRPGVSHTRRAARLQRSHAGGIDHKIDPPQDTGVWSRSNQKALQDLTVLTVFGGALWLGADNAVGHTFWQSLDATALGAVTAQVMKPVFSRRGRADRRSRRLVPGVRSQQLPERGSHGGDDGASRRSCWSTVPSIRSSTRSSLLPIYDGIARIKSAGALADRRAGEPRDRNGDRLVRP